MKRYTAVAKSLGKKALFVASAFAIGKSTVAVMGASQVGMCLYPGLQSCAWSNDCDTDADARFWCSCQGTTCQGGTNNC